MTGINIRLISAKSVKCTAIVILLMLVSIKATGAPLWKGAANSQFKLFGKVLIADEKGSRWDESLPEGWSWTANLNRPGRYYMDLGQLEPVKTGSRVVFALSRWNFINSALQEGFTEDAVLRKTLQLRKLPEIRFKEDAKFTEARQQFQDLGTEEARPKLTLHRRLEFSISVSGIVVVQTSSQKLLKLFVENYSTTAFITVLSATDQGTPSQNKVQHLVRIIEHPWRTDLDGDGLVDIEWQPISHIESSMFIAPRGTKIGILKTFR
jgi:hypothetical protein